MATYRGGKARPSQQDQQDTPAQQATAGMMTGREFAPELLQQLLTDPRVAAFEAAQTPVAGEGFFSQGRRMSKAATTQRRLDPRAQQLKDAIQSSGGLMTPEGINANAVDAISRLGSPTQQTAATAIRQALAKDRFNLKQQTTFRDNVIAQYPKLAPFKNIITQENITDLLQQVAGVGGTTLGMQKDTAKIMIDEVGNYYESFTLFNPNTGQTIERTVPYGGSPENYVGKLTLVSQNPTDVEGRIKVLEAGTREEKIRAQNQADINKVSSIQEFKEKEFIKIKLPALASALELEFNIEQTNDAIDYVDTLELGGPVVNFRSDVARLLGVGSGERADLEYLLAQNILGRLKATFGGVISEGERNYLEAISPNVRRGNAENRAILETLRNIQQNIILRNTQLRQSATYDEYMDRINGIVEGTFNYPSAGNLEREDLTDEQIEEQAKIFYKLYPQFSPKQ